MAETEAAGHYALALRLGKSVTEILDLPREELAGWRAYLAQQSRG